MKYNKIRREYQLTKINGMCSSAPTPFWRNLSHIRFFKRY